MELTLLLLLFTSWIPASRLLDIDYCVDQLGLEDGSLIDDAFTASSSYDPMNVGPKNARLNSDIQGGAWCPREPVSREKDDQYLEVNLYKTHVITEILTQGRFANGQGQEYAQAYRIEYWREGLSDYKTYRDNVGKTILPGNKDTYTVAENTLNPPLLASKIRILPYSNHSRTVCLRVGFRGCAFTEGVTSYNIPQGMVRGSTLELLDITYDGLEDQVTGHLRGGLGQLVDGKYGPDDFKAVGDNGIVKGYDWVGWKNRSEGPLQLDFTFDTVRLFQKVAIHTNNHYTRDIQIFSRAKIYFSNEEGKFGDDRAVDFSYMPDQMIEEARNVTINLHGEHGKYVMIHLFFASKWILISEITFWSEIFKEKPFPVPPSYDEVDPQQPLLPEDIFPAKITPPPQPASPPRSADRPANSDSSLLTVQTAEEEDAQSKYVGLIIGILLTLISVLLAGIFFVMYRGRQGKETPSHSLLATKIQDKLAASIDFKDMTTSYTPYKAKMRVYGHVPINEEEDGNLYASPIIPQTYQTTFPSLNKKFSSDPVLSEDCTDDYAEPQLAGVGRHHQLNSASFSDNIYSQTFHPAGAAVVGGGGANNNNPPGSALLLAQNTVNIYTKPVLSPLSPASQIFSSSPDSQPFMTYTPPSSTRFSPPQRHSPPKTLNLKTAYGSSGRGGRTRAHSASHPEICLPLYDAGGGQQQQQAASPAQSSLSSVDQQQQQRFYSGRERTSSSSRHEPAREVVYSRKEELPAVYSKVKKSPEQLQQQQQLQLQQQQQQQQQSTRSRRQSNTTAETDHNKNLPPVPVAEPRLISRSLLKIVEKVGRGEFGDVHLCHFVDTASTSSSSLVAVKSLEAGSPPVLRISFETEARILSAITDPNIATVVGANFSCEPCYMVCEYSEQGDLNQYLQDHVAETSLSKSPGVATLSYGSLIYMATQIASGMKYLESINFIHRDLATRNCLVYPKYCVKISDCGTVKPGYTADYYHSLDGSRLPVRWMAWESIVLGKYTTKSDVWSFGVTFWEILTFAREQPFEELGDEKVLENISSLYQTGDLQQRLPHPYNCPRDIFDLMSECWHKVESERPNFREIHLFLQRKNLGFSPEKEHQK